MRLNEKGSALLFVLMVMSLVTCLGFALLNITLSDYRVSSHLADMDRAYYAAEAGVQMAYAVLPKKYEEYISFEKTIVREQEPHFTVDICSDGNRKLIKSTGKWSGKTKVVNVVADICHLGGYVLISGGELLLNDVTFDGKKVEVDKEYSVDFEDYEKKATEEVGWLITGGEAGAVLFRDFICEGGQQKIFVAGDLVIEGFFCFDGLLVVRGCVDINSGHLDGSFVLLAEDDISFTVDEIEGEHVAIGSCFLYCGGRITDRRTGFKRRFLFHGTMMAAGDIDLEEFDLVYNDKAVSECFFHLPENLFLPFTAFVLTWIDFMPRR